MTGTHGMCSESDWLHGNSAHYNLLLGMHLCKRGQVAELISEWLEKYSHIVYVQTEYRISCEHFR